MTNGRWKDKLTFFVERRASFTFTIGSILYGAYHLVNPEVLTDPGAYMVISSITGMLGGFRFGVLFVALGGFKLYGLLADEKLLKLPMYFALLFLWLLLSVCFLIAHCRGQDNAAWVYTLIIAGLSTNIIETKSKSRSGRDG